MRLSVLLERPVRCRLNVCEVEFNTVGTKTSSGGSGGIGGLVCDIGAETGECPMKKYKKCPYCGDVKSRVCTKAQCKEARQNATQILAIEN